MQWINYIFACLFAVPGLLFIVENWRAWYWNTFKRGKDEPATYYPVFGGFLLFMAVGYILPADYALWAFSTVIIDFGCLPLFFISCKRVFRKKTV